MTVLERARRSSSLDPEERLHAACLHKDLHQTAIGPSRVAGDHPWPSVPALDLFTLMWRSQPRRRLDQGWQDALIRAACILFGRTLEDTFGREALRDFPADLIDELWRPWRPSWQDPFRHETAPLPPHPPWLDVWRTLQRHWCGEGKRAGWGRRLARIFACHAHAAEYTSCVGHKRYRPIDCGSFACQRCMRKARARQVLIGRQLLEQVFEDRPRMVTLTVPSWPRVRGMRDHLRGAFGKLRRDPWWRAHVRGGFFVEEFEWSEQSGAHLHLHIAVDSGWIPINRLVERWQIACGCRCHRDPGGWPQLCAYTEGWEVQNEGKSSWGRYRWARASDACPGRRGGMPSPAGQSIDVGRAALERELAKYLSKGFMGGGESWPPWVLAEVLETWWGRPRLTRFGACHGVKLEERKRDEPRCPHCGATCWEWSGTVPWVVYRDWMQREREAKPPP